MEYVGFVAMNCQYHESTGMSNLRHLLIKNCEKLRIHEPITFDARCFLVFLVDSYIHESYSSTNQNYFQENKKKSAKTFDKRN